MEILSVKQFNQDADRRYRERVSEFEYGKGGFPFRPMFVFQTPKGFDRKRGFVVVKDGIYQFFLTRKKLNEHINKDT